MGYSRGYDKLLFPIGAHKVMYDRLQMVIQHPSTCPHRGAGVDRYKTFHPWLLALKRLDLCEEQLTEPQRQLLIEQGKQVDAVPR